MHPFNAKDIIIYAPSNGNKFDKYIKDNMNFNHCLYVDA